LVDITTGPILDLVLVDTDLDGLSGGVHTWAQRQIGRKIILGIVSVTVPNAKVFGLHDECEAKVMRWLRKSGVQESKDDGNKEVLCM
jgi:hypothetical protein